MTSPPRSQMSPPPCSHSRCTGCGSYPWCREGQLGEQLCPKNQKTSVRLYTVRWRTSFLRAQIQGDVLTDSMKFNLTVICLIHCFKHVLDCHELCCCSDTKWKTKHFKTKCSKTGMGIIVLGNSLRRGRKASRAAKCYLNSTRCWVCINNVILYKGMPFLLKIAELCISFLDRFWCFSFRVESRFMPQSAY